MPAESIFLAGPTAVGKSEIALLLAEKIGGEIISVDSMQVYRGMDIGTAKPSAADRRRAEHHLLDMADLTQPFDAAQFIRHARAAVEKIRSQARIPIFCGGTGLYFQAFQHGLGDAPPANQELRATLSQAPLPDLLGELQSRDPATFAKIDRKNRRRVARAIEVIRLTGKPFSNQRAKWSEDTGGSGTTRRLGFSRYTADLHRRISLRVDQMFAAGLVGEVERLLTQGLEQNQAAMQALGYRQVVEHLRQGVPLDKTIELVKLRTRQFAKRQMTWFRRQAQLTWLMIEPEETPAMTLSRVCSELRQKTEI